MPDNAPLIGVRVLELGQVIAGNYAGLLLADLGADVVKIESPAGDPARNAAVAPLRGESALHLTVNRGKRSMVVDLKADRGRELVHLLARRADAVLDNLRPGVMERLGLDFATLAGINPSIVCVSVSGFGQSGPARDRPAFDLVIQALSGHMSITGEPGSQPVRMGAPMADLVGGMFGAFSVLAGLVSRGSTGRGRRVDVSMLDCLVSMLSYDATLFLNTGEQPERLGSGHAHIVPWQAFATSDGHVAIAARDERFWRALCDAIDRPELADHPSAATNPQRVANREWVVSELQAVLRRRCTADWLRRFEAFDIPAAPVNDLTGAFSDPQVVARAMVGTCDGLATGPYRFVHSPARFDGWDAPSIPPPRLGEHTRELLAELGLGKVAVEELFRAGIVA
ncbi:MAG: CaiB/BaiF CoA transferase family protein [Acidimicrobiales bacterium]